MTLSQVIMCEYKSKKQCVLTGPCSLWTLNSVKLPQYELFLGAKNPTALLKLTLVHQSQQTVCCCLRKRGNKTGTLVPGWKTGMFLSVRCSVTFSQLLRYIWICCSISSLYELSAFFWVTVTSWISSDLNTCRGETKLLHIHTLTLNRIHSSAWWSLEAVLSITGNKEGSLHLFMSVT